MSTAALQSRSTGVSAARTSVSVPASAVSPAPAQSEKPTAELSASFKQAMRHLAGGVALVSTTYEGSRHGLTVTAVSSLTMDPPALLVSVNRNASAFDALIKSGHFCVNLLTHAQVDLAAAFARKPDGEARFANGTWRVGASGLPVLEECVVSIACRMHDMVEYGTHAILIGAVEHLEIATEPVSPLLYLNGKFGSFGPFSA
jgi:flavin reductase (DIM6/NTAB) family NADH-FMN oxidoreductase RutF